MRGEPLQHGGAALLRAHAGRKRDQALRRHRGELGVGAGNARVGDLVPDPHLGHVRRDGRDGAAGLEAERQRERELVLAGALVDVDVVDPRRVDLDDRLAGLGRGLGNIFEAQDFGAAGRGDADRFHAGILREVGIDARGL